MIIIRTLYAARFKSFPSTLFKFCNQNKIKDGNPSEQPILENAAEKQGGTQYTKWAIARTGQSHNVEISRRSLLKDRYSIHRITNIDFMAKYITKSHTQKIYLTINEEILFLTQFIHITELVGRKQQFYIHLMNTLFFGIYQRMGDPDDLICMGTFMSCAVTLGILSSLIWEGFMEEIFRKKYDEEFDQLFGMIVALAKFRKHLLSLNDSIQISKDTVLPKIPIFYRKSLHVLRQFIAINIYNLKQCQLIFEALYFSNINESYFWDSVRDWFNIFMKQQVKKKMMDQFFIMKESAVELILFDHGMIRPRPILQELSSIAFILSQFGNISWRFIEFAQDLIAYAQENGSKLYARYLQIQRDQDALQQKKPKDKVEKHFQIYTEEERRRIQKMQARYRTIFVNPIKLKSKYVIYLVITFARAYKQYREPTQKLKQQQKMKYFYDKQETIGLDPRVKKWLFIQLIKNQAKYTVRELILLFRAEEFLREFNINIVGFISEKLKNLRYTAATFAQIQQILRILPKQNYHRLNQVIGDFLASKHPSQVLKITKKFQNQSLFPYIGQYILHIPKIVNLHEKYYSFEQCCYFMYIVLQHAEVIKHIQNQKLFMQYLSQFEKLKHTIKITTYNRGFKISVNSYFHKILDYIDVVDFFEGGRV